MAVSLEELHKALVRRFQGNFSIDCGRKRIYAVNLDGGSGRDPDGKREYHFFYQGSRGQWLGDITITQQDSGWIFLGISLNFPIFFSRARYRGDILEWVNRKNQQPETVVTFYLFDPSEVGAQAETLVLKCCRNLKIPQNLDIPGIEAFYDPALSACLDTMDRFLQDNLDWDDIDEGRESKTPQAPHQPHKKATMKIDGSTPNGGKNPTTTVPSSSD